MNEKIRFRCPCCGMMADLDRLQFKHKIQVFRQEFGGKVAGNNKGRGKAKGYMKYTNITRTSAQIVHEIEEMIKEAYQNIKNRE